MSSRKLFESKFIPDKISKILVEISIIAVILSVMVLVHPIRYMVYIFAVSLTWLLFSIGIRYHHKFKISLPLSRRFIDYFFIVSSTGLLVSLLTDPIPSLSFVLSVVVSVFMPGWVFLRLLKVDSIRRSSLDLLVLSFLVSIALSSITFLVVFSFKTGTDSEIVLSVIYVGISFLSLLIHRGSISNISNEDKLQSYLGNESGTSEYSLYNILLLVWVLIFFIFVISTLYPQMAYVPDSDIVRLFSASKELITAPNNFASNYPWFQFIWTSVMQLSSPPVWLFQSGFACLSIISIFSFYIMAKAYLSGIDKRAPLFATIFFSVFSGFAWSQDNPGVSQYWHILSISNNPPYSSMGIGQILWLWAWFRPITLGLAIFLVLIYLMRHVTVAKNRYIIISSLLMLTLIQVHIPEFVIYVAFLFVISLFFPLIKLRLKEMAISAIIAVSASAFLLNVLYPSILISQYGIIPNEYFLVLYALAGSTYLLTRYHRRPKIHLKTNFIPALPIALAIYFIFLIYWFANSDFFSPRQANSIYAVPLELYPILLGVVGIFAIPGFLVLARKYRNQPVIVFAVLFLFIIVFGRALTYINLNFQDTGYWERRLIPFVFVSCSVLDSVVVLRVIDYLSKRKHDMATTNVKGLSRILTITFLSFLVLGGILSTFLGLEFQIVNTAIYGLTDKEIKLEEALNKLSPSSTVLTVSGRSASIAEFAPFSKIIGDYRYQVWQSNAPELPLNVMYSPGSKSVVYISEKDLKQISNNKGYLATHILKVAPVTNNASGAGIVLQMPTFTPPYWRSNMLLVLPERTTIGGAGLSNYYYAYDILSLGGYNYTTALLSDINSINKSKIIVAPTEEVALKLMQYKSAYNLQYDKLIVLNIEGYGQLVQIGSSKPSPSSLVLAKNNTAGSSTRWVAAGIGAGKIGVPKITDNLDSTILSRNLSSFAISVGSGNYGLWQISKLLDGEPLNLSRFDFAQFGWYGRDDGRWYVMQFFSAPNQSFWYSFKDTWTGWKQVILPMHIHNGLGYSYGVTFDKIAGRGASWSKITRIDFRTEASNLNQAGEFYLRGLGFGTILHSSGINGIPTKQVLRFYPDIDVYPIIPNSKYNTIAYYDVGVPFVIQRIYKDYDMFYLNVYPIVQKLNSTATDDVVRHFYPLLGKLLTLTQSNLQTYESMKAGKIDFDSGQVAVFKNATFVGGLTVKSSSTVIRPGSSSSLDVIIHGKDLILNKPVSEIIPINMDTVTLKSGKGGTISGGSGFYTNISLHRSSTSFIGHPAVLLLYFRDGTNTTLTGKEIQISLTNSNMLLRQPRVTSEGTIQFANFYGYGQLNDKYGAPGQDLTLVDSKVNFNTEYSNAFTITNATSLHGKVISNNQSTYLFSNFWILEDFSPSHILIYSLILAAIYGFSKLYTVKRKKATIHSS